MTYVFYSRMTNSLIMSSIYSAWSLTVEHLRKDSLAPRFERGSRSYFPLNVPYFIPENHPDLIDFSGKNGPKIDQDEMAKCLGELGYRYLNKEYFLFNGRYYQKVDEHTLFDEIVHMTQQGSRPPVPSIQFKRNVISHFESLFPLPDGSEAIEKDPRYDDWLIPFENGIYNVYRDELLPFSPYVGLTSVIHADYIPEEHHPVERLYRMMLPDDDGKTLDCFLQAVGYTLYSPVMNPPAIFLLVGPGGSGKSTVLRILETLLGSDMVASSNPYQLSTHFGVSNLKDKKANLCDETATTVNSHRSKIDGDRIKALASGGNIEIEKKYQDAQNYNNEAKLWFASNGIPDLGDTTKGMERRVYSFSFGNDLREIGFTDYDFETLFSYEGLAWLAFRSLKAYVSFLVSGKKDLDMSESMKEFYDVLFAHDAFVSFFRDRVEGSSKEDVQNYLDGKEVTVVYNEFVAFAVEGEYDYYEPRGKFTQRIKSEYVMGSRAKGVRIDGQSTSRSFFTKVKPQ